MSNNHDIKHDEDCENSDYCDVRWIKCDFRNVDDPCKGCKYEEHKKKIEIINTKAKEIRWKK